MLTSSPLTALQEADVPCYAAESPETLHPDWRLEGTHLADLLKREAETHFDALLHLDFQRVTRRWLKRYARLLAVETGEPEDLLYRAFYTPVCNAVVHYLPLKAWVARLAHEGKLPSAVAVPLDRLDGSCFAQPSEDPVASLLTAYAFARKGVKVHVYGPPGDGLRYHAFRDEHPLRFLYLAGGKILVPQHVRRLEPLREAAGYRRSRAIRLNHKWRNACFDWRFRRAERRHQAELPSFPLRKMDGGQRLPLNGLADYFLKEVLLGEYRYQQRLLAWRLPSPSRGELLLCDLPRMDTVLAAERARHIGMRVTLLPHSTNPNGLDVWNTAAIDRFVTVTGTGAARVRAAMPAVETQTVSSTMLLPEAVQPPQLSPEAPLQLVLIGNFIRKAQLFMVPPVLHRQSVATVLSIPQELQARVKLLVKTKPNRDEAELYQQAAPAGTEVPFWKQSLEKLTVPNQVYVSVNRASAALIEAINRGIPALLLQDIPLPDHVPIETAPIPRLRFAQFWEQVEELTRPEAYRALVQRQQQWLHEELKDNRPLASLFGEAER